MGRRSTNTTKSGKFMNPTDQARKEARKRELKKNKKQRKLVRETVLKLKDPTQIIEEMLRLDLLGKYVYDLHYHDFATQVYSKESRYWALCLSVGLKYLRNCCSLLFLTFCMKLGVNKVKYEAAAILKKS